jgi:multidrug resistance efflux pump
MSDNEEKSKNFTAASLPVNGNGRLNNRSQLTQDVITRQPTFVERWGLLLFLALLLILFGCTWFVDYPDVIEAGAILTAENAPKEIVSQQDGRLVKLFVKNDQEVKRQQMIGWIESTASHEDVIDLGGKLDKGLQQLSLGRTKDVSLLFTTRYLNMGELQNDYQRFIGAWQQFNDYFVNDFYIQKRNFLLNDLQTLSKVKENLLHQQAIVEQNVQLATESFDMNNTLLQQKIISKEDLRNEKSRLFNKQLELPQLKGQLLSNETQQRDKQKEIDQLEHDIAQQKIIFQQALQVMKSATDDWMKKFVLQSPVDGKVTFFIPLQENQLLRKGKLLGYVYIPDTKYYAELNLPQSNFGKADTGLLVQLHFDAYPFEEFGSVNGKLNYISTLPSDSGFLATVSLDNGLFTTHGKIIQYKSRLNARAFVITRNTNLLMRLYYGIVKATSMQK